MTTVPTRQSYEGPTLFSNGFRPFFLLGSIYAGLAILVWLPVFYGEISLTSAFAPRDWHVHEMLYGYLPAVITGFLFTAIPNWTGRLPIRGTPLMALVTAWVAGRLCVTFSAETGWLSALLIDASFLLLVALAAGREIVAGRNWRNLAVVMLVLLLLAGNVAFHLEAHFAGAADISIRIGIAVVVILVKVLLFSGAARVLSIATTQTYHEPTTISGDVRADWSEAFALVPSLQVGYVWYASAHTLEVLQGLLGIGFELAQQIIWDKGLFSIGRSWYHWAHEPCLVVRKPGVPNLFIGEHDQATIWRAPSPKRIGSGSKEHKEDHPTQKPVVLSEIPIRNHLRPGEAVYEPFSGSGTTLMAAETLGRRCYAMEIDPKYVQVAIERWQNFTGQEAVLLG